MTGHVDVEALTGILAEALNMQCGERPPDTSVVEHAVDRITALLAATPTVPLDQDAVAWSTDGEFVCGNKLTRDPDIAAAWLRDGQTVTALIPQPEHAAWQLAEFDGRVVELRTAPVDLRWIGRNLRLGLTVRPLYAGTPLGHHHAEKDPT